MFEYRLEHIMSYTAKLGEREVIGPGPEGLRVNVPVIGGEVTGPKVFGKVRPLSGDWLTIRRDGVAILDVRGTIETTDGALIYVTYFGTSDRGEDGYEKALQGNCDPRADPDTDFAALLYLPCRLSVAQPSPLPWDWSGIPRTGRSRSRRLRCAVKKAIANPGIYCPAGTSAMPT